MPARASKEMRQVLQLNTTLLRWCGVDFVLAYLNPSPFSIPGLSSSLHLSLSWQHGLRLNLDAVDKTAGTTASNIGKKSLHLIIITVTCLNTNNESLFLFLLLDVPVRIAFAVEIAVAATVAVDITTANAVNASLAVHR